MKLKKSLTALAIAGLCLAAAPAGAVVNSLLFQGVTFETEALDSNTLRLSILNATSATGNWMGIGFLEAFEIKGVGAVTGASITSGSSFASFIPAVVNGLSGSSLGCGTGGTPGACFAASSPVALTGSMGWTIDFAGSNLDLSSPHLKVQFLTSATDTRKTGSLLSQDIATAISEPEIYAMLAAGLGLMGWISRRRKQTELQID